MSGQPERRLKAGNVSKIENLNRSSPHKINQVSLVLQQVTHEYLTTEKLFGNLFGAQE